MKDRLLAASWRILIAVLYLFLLAPIIVVLIVSFDTRPYLDFPPRSLSWGSYAGVLHNTGFLRSIGVSTVIAIIAAVCSLAFGVMVALALVRHRSAASGAVEWLFLSPLLVPHIVLAVGLMMVLQPLGLLNTIPGLVLAHLGITLPYTTRIVSMGLSGLDRTCEEAARIHGASVWRTYWRITIPSIRPSLIAAGMIAFLVSFDEAVIALFIAGNHVVTLPLAIYQYIQFRTDPEVAALSMLVVIVSLVPIVIVERSISLRRAIIS